jgi:nitrite reductase/ring-hydroxylating ferredoxin subunit
MEVYIGTADELVAGEVKRASLGADAEGKPFEVMVLREASGRIVAYRNLCRHLPVPLDGGTGELLTDDGAHLICGTHGALYRLGDGLCVEGPCEGASLEPLCVRVEAGRIYVSRVPA